MAEQQIPAPRVPTRDVIGEGAEACLDMFPHDSFMYSALHGCVTAMCDAVSDAVDEERVDARALQDALKPLFEYRCIDVFVGATPYDDSITVYLIPVDGDYELVYAWAADIAAWLSNVLNGRYTDAHHRTIEVFVCNAGTGAFAGKLNTIVGDDTDPDHADFIKKTVEAEYPHGMVSSLVPALYPE